MLKTVFLISIAGASAAWAQATQPSKTENTPAFMGPCSTLSCEIENDWTRNNVMLYMLAGAMPEDKYGFRPVREEQSFGERVVHVAQVNAALLKGLGAKASPPVIDANATSKTAAMAALKKAGEYGSAIIMEFGDAQLTARVSSPWFMGPVATRQRIIYFLMTHSQDTYGQLVVYLRLNGIVPPASRQP